MKPSPSPGQEGPFSRREIAFLVGMPLAWAVLLLFHPGGEADDIYGNVQDKVTQFLVVHVGMMVFIPLMALAVFVLLRGVQNAAARVSRVAVVVFAVFYGTWETLQGIGVGILADEVNGLPPSERAVGAQLVQDFAEHPLSGNPGVFTVIGTLALILALIFAGVALRRHAGAPVAVPVVLGFAALLITAHPPPFGPIGLALWIVAVWLYIHSQTSPRAAGAVEPHLRPG